MAITGKLYAAHIEFGEDGAVTMQAHVSLHDDDLGELGARTIGQDNPAIIAAVVGFVQQMLPAVSKGAGLTVTLKGQ